MTDYERLEERCNFAEAKCQQLQEQLDRALAQLDEATSIALDAVNLLAKCTPPEEAEEVDVMIVVLG